MTINPSGTPPHASHAPARARVSAIMRRRGSARERGSVYLFVLAVVGMATAAALVALASTDTLVERAFDTEETAKAELQAVTAQDLAMQLLHDEDDPLSTYKSGYIINRKSGDEVHRAWLTGYDGSAVLASGSTGIRLWTEGIRDSARSLRSVDLERFAPISPGGEEAVVNQNPLAYWPLSAAAGTFGRDVVGSAHATFSGGAEVGATSGPGARPAALLDGVDGRIVVPHEDWMLLGSWSISLWVRFDATPNRDQTIFSKDAENGQQHVELYLSAAGTIVLTDNAVAGNTVQTDKGLITKGRWHHIVVSTKYGRTRIHIDDTKVSESSVWFPLVLGSPRNTEPLVLGAGQDRALSGTGLPVNDAMIGSIAEVALFAGELSNGSVQTLYEAHDDIPVSLRTLAGTASRRSD